MTIYPQWETLSPEADNSPDRRGSMVDQTHFHPYLKALLAVTAYRAFERQAERWTITRAAKPA